MRELEIKLKRIEAGIKQYQLASRLGISPTYLCEIEMDRRRSSTELIKRIVATIDQQILTINRKQESNWMEKNG